MTKKKKQQPAKRFPVLPVVGGLVVLVGVIAIAASRGHDTGSSSGHETRPVAVDGAALAALPAQGADPAAGSPAPVLRGAAFDGTPITIGERGTPQVVLFVAHWCPHCRREVPVIARWLRTAQLGNVKLLAVATSTTTDRPNYPPSTWLKQEGWTIVTLADDARSSAATAYGVSGFPFFAVIDAKGTIVTRTSGELPVAELERLIAAAGAS